MACNAWLENHYFMGVKYSKGWKIRYFQNLRLFHRVLWNSQSSFSLTKSCTEWEWQVKGTIRVSSNLPTIKLHTRKILPEFKIKSPMNWLWHMRVFLQVRILLVIKFFLRFYLPQKMKFRWFIFYTIYSVIKTPPQKLSSGLAEITNCAVVNF